MSARFSVSSQTFGFVGFVVSNANGGADNPKPVRILVRAAGPSLRAFGVSGAPKVVMDLQISSNRIIATYAQNRDAINSAAIQVGAFAFTAAGGDDAAIIEVPAGSFTAIVRGDGEVLVEAYQMPSPGDAPPAPIDLVVSKSLGYSITLEWKDNAGSFPGFSRYQIYRSIKNEFSSAQLIAQQRSGASYMDAGLSLYIRYFYWVTAVASGGLESEKSNVTSGVANSGS